ncbi:AA_permease_C domain-containing protein [Caerostris darwini]|uniref:AA_permease_C domain-containing protein n=1 Tax=Caerostris darwini TaxID=1538125 RepID=A0AAV4QKF1_9ARAC|nr:AA_permease_C domain-containing protein [Caerostris darwini]
MFVIGSQNFRQKMLVILGKLIRTKDAELADPAEAKAQTQLKKVLTTLDLTSLGVGSCVGTGMYLVAGMVAHKVAGPSVVMSFIVAAVASLFSVLKWYATLKIKSPCLNSSPSLSTTAFNPFHPNAFTLHQANPINPQDHPPPIPSPQKTAFRTNAIPKLINYPISFHKIVKR